jgi:OPA family sugar phosphate sensor protein UhpC-like MFS transporter
MSFLPFLRPAPLIEEIRDPEAVKKSYKYWRLRIFLGMYVGYAFYYFTRKSFTFAMPALQSELGLGKFELGLLASILSLTYGASKFVSGILGDQSNPRYFMSVGLILTGIFNLFFGFSSSLWMFAVFWGLNGWFQGWGWPGCAKLLTHWYSQNERGRWWGLWNTSHNLGGALIPIVAAICADRFGWRAAMYVPGILCIGAGFYLMHRLRDIPQSLGLPPIEKFRNDYVSKQALEKESQPLSTREILVEHVFKNRFLWVLAFAYFFVYVIRTAINDWSMLYLVEMKGYTNLTAGFCVCWFEIGGFFGSLVAGWSSDLLFKGKRNPINVLFMIAMFCLILAFQSYHLSLPYLDGLFLFLFGFFIFGPQMLIGMAATEISHKKAAATANGFAGCFAYLGAAAAGAPLGVVTREWGWNAFLLTLIGCSVAATALLLPLWSVKQRERKEKPDTTPVSNAAESAQ